MSHIKFINSLCRVLENPQSLDIIVIKHEHKMIMSIFVFYTSSCVKYILKGYYEAAGRDTGIISIPESSSICNIGTDTGKY